MSIHTSTFSFPVATLADRRHVSRCHNLRPSRSGGLRAVGLPRLVASLPGAVPVRGGTFTLPDGVRCMLMHHQGCLKAVIGSGPAASTLTLCNLPSVPSCALATDSGVIVMSANERPRRFRFTRSEEGDVGWSVAESPLFPSLPPLMIVRRDMGTISSTVPAFTLRSSYTTTTQHLSEADQAIADRAMREAYVALSDRALLHGRYIQPVMARYRLIGHDGAVLYTSAPVIVAPESGLQGIRTSLNLTGEGFRQSGEGTLSAAEFVPGIAYTREPDEAWRALVSSVQLLVSPQLHPYSASLPGSCSRVSSSATALTLSFTLPGVDPLQSYAAPGGRVAGYVASMLADTDRWLTADGPASDTAAEMARLKSLAASSVTQPTTESMLAFRLSAPHAFTATACARSGDLIAWGGLTALPFEGYALPEMTVTRADTTASVPTAMLVNMRDGSSVVRSAVMVRSTPTGVSPLVLYPSAEAESITLLAGSKAVTLPLTPSACGRWAYYLAPDMCPVRLTEDRGGFALPASSPSAYACPSALMMCHESSPLAPLAVTRGDASAVTALLPAVRHSNSFTVPSARFYVLGAGGISSMTLTDSRRRINLNLLDGRGVTSPEAATLIPGGMAVIASGALLTVTGSRPTTLREHCDGDMLGWCDRYGELWCIDSSGGHDISVLSVDGSVEYTRTVSASSSSDAVASVSTGGSHFALVTCGGDILDPSDEVDGEVTAVHESTVSHSFRPGQRAALTADVSGRGVRGTVTFTASHGRHSCARLTLRTLAVDGDLCHPLYEPVILPHSHALTKRIELTTSSPSTLILNEP